MFLNYNRYDLSEKVLQDRDAYGMMQAYGLFLDEVLEKVEEEFGKVVQLLVSEIVSCLSLISVDGFLFH